MSELAGVNVARVKKVIIGIGNHEEPTAGGRGRIFSDDLRRTVAEPTAAGQ